MTADELKAAYARSLDEIIIVRRYTGAGANRPRFDVKARGKSWGYAPSQLIGTIQQGDQTVLVFADDLLGRGFRLPLTVDDKIVQAGKEKSIKSLGDRKAPDGTLIVYDLQVRG